MNTRLAGLMLFVVSAPAFAAGPEQGKFSMSLFGGADTPISGDVHDGAVAPVPDLGPLNPDLAGVSAELRIQPRGHEDIYDQAFTYGLEFSYGLSDRAEVFGQVRRTEADPGTVRVGGAFVPALNTELPVYGTFSDYKALSLEAGYRYYFMQPGSARPFVAGRLGATQTDDIRVTFEIPDAAITIANAPGTTPAYALGPLEERGKLFAAEGDNVYEGQLVGIHSKDNDLTVNVIKAKPLTNMRASGKDDAIQLSPAIKYTLEQALDFIEDDELVEVTPKEIRLRKKFLTESDRKRASRSA